MSAGRPGLGKLMALLLEDWDWTDRAACRGTDPTLFVPDRAQDSRAYDHAKSICGGCPVRSQCLDVAMRHPQLSGVWGGTNGRDRQKLRAARRHGAGAA